MPRLIKVAVAEGFEPRTVCARLSLSRAALPPPRTSVARRIRVASRRNRDRQHDWQATDTDPWPRTCQRYRPTGSVPADARVAHLRCRGMRLWHPGSAHRGVHGDTSRATVSLPSHGVMVCETSS